MFGREPERRRELLTLTPAQWNVAMRIRRAYLKFPDTKPRNILGRARALERRRAKNRRARASRKANR